MGISAVSVYFPYGDGNGGLYDIYHVCGIDETDGEI